MSIGLRASPRVSLRARMTEIRVELPMRGLTMDEIVFWIARMNREHPERIYYLSDEENAVVSAPRRG